MEVDFYKKEINGREGHQWVQKSKGGSFTIFNFFEFKKYLFIDM